ncbi:MAG: carbamoyl phosphate synthase small subunit, partial [candidate division NC10 bacterium]|nr:carbamoyl phosphate synthase small subunit [candidate division NC10 bacterium]
LTVRIRDDGEMWGIVSGEEAGREELLKRVKDYNKKARKDFIRSISVKEISEIGGNGSGPKIAILDLGVTHRLLEPLRSLAGRIWLLPHTTEAEAILRLRPEGLILSNGPEEDEAIPQVVETVRKLIGKIPLLGISTGHQILCLALGGRLQRMKVGHHGANYPVISPSSFKGEITFQNHSWVADEESLRGRSEVQITLRNLNDQSVEELESRSLKLISIQYYPLNLGIGEPNPVFMRFLAMIAENS